MRRYAHVGTRIGRPMTVVNDLPSSMHSIDMSVSMMLHMLMKTLVRGGKRERESPTGGAANQCVNVIMHENS